MKLAFYLLMIYCMLISTIAEAQIKKGSVLLGGTINYNKTKFENIPHDNASTSSRMISFGPSVGYALKDNLVLGIKLAYGREVTKSAIYTKSEHQSAGAFLRQYWSIGGKFLVYAQAEGNFVVGERWYRNLETGHEYSRNKITICNALIRPGFSFAVSQKVQLETSLMEVLAVQFTKTESHTHNQSIAYTEVKQFDINTGFRAQNMFSIGLKVIL